MAEVGGYCARHQPPARQKADRSGDSFYSSAAWRRLRRWFLRENPCCTNCGEPALEVDHRTPITSGGAKLDPANLQSLCKSCHSRKTLNESRYSFP